MKDYRNRWTISRDNRARRFVVAVGEGSDRPRKSFSWDKHGGEAAAEAAALLYAAQHVSPKVYAEQLRPMKGLAAPKKKKSPRVRKPLTHEQALAILEEARKGMAPGYKGRAVQTPYGLHFWGILKLLATYAHRPVTACRMQVQDVLNEGRHIVVRVKDRNGPREHLHPTLPEDREWLHSLTLGRGPHQALFKGQDGRAWPLLYKKDSPHGTADTLAQRFRWWAKRAGVTGVSIYCLKDLAWSRMDSGDGAWPRALSDAEKGAFTGHRLPERVSHRYQQRGLIRSDPIIRLAESIAGVTPQDAADIQSSEPEDATQQGVPVFKTAAFSRSAIPPLPVVDSPDDDDDMPDVCDELPELL